MTETTLALTVTEHVAVLPPSFVLTVIVAVPGVFAVTTPEDETVATEVLFEVQVTDLSVAFEGLTVAVSVWLSPSVIVRLVLSRLTPVTDITFALTVTVHVAVLLPSFVLTVIVAVPGVFAVTTPEDETVATVVLFEVQVTDLSVALLGETVAVSVWVSPSVIFKDVLSRLTPVTAITFALTVTVHIADFPPSFVFTVIVALPSDFAMTTPVEETIATDSLSEDHVTDLSVAFSGDTVAVKDCVSPSVSVSSDLSRVTPDT